MGDSIINKVFLKGGILPLTPARLALEAGKGFLVSDFPARISGSGHCACKNGGEFELMSTDDPGFVDGDNRHMQCRICGEWSHL